MISVNIRKLKLHHVLSILTFLILVALYLFLVVYWKQIPDQVPGHYNAAGMVDRWGSKGEILICPIMALVMYIGIAAVTRYPQIWNTGVQVTEQNKQFVYQQLKNMLVTLNFVLVAVFSFITVRTALCLPLTAWFLPVSLIAEFGPIAYYMFRVVRYSKK